MAGAIAAGDLSQRVPEQPVTTEVGSLSRSLNGMLAQIEYAFGVRAASEARMRQFVADASHELRTPLAAVRGYAELYRQGAVREPEDVASAMRRIEDEAARLGLLVEDLLLLARLDEEREIRDRPGGPDRPGGRRGPGRPGHRAGPHHHPARARPGRWRRPRSRATSGGCARSSPT